MAGFDFYEKMFTKVDATLLAYWQDVASDIAASISPVAYTMIAIYIMLWGWSMMRGIISEPITDAATRIIRLAVITGIALNVGRYNTYLADMLWNSPDALAAIVSNGGTTGVGSAQFLDTLMDRFYDIGEAYNEVAHANSTLGVPDLTALFAGYAIFASGVALTGYAAFLLVLAKIALAVLLGIGPIAILLTIFEGTKRFFDSWLGQALNFVFMVLLAAAVTKLILTIIESYLGSPSVIANMDDVHLSAVIPAVAFSLVGLLVLLQVQPIASALGGGAAISTLGAVGWAYGKAKSGGKSAWGEASGKNRSDRIAARRAKVNNARWAKNNPSMATQMGRAAAGAPAAVYRKITSRSNRVSRG